MGLSKLFLAGRIVQRGGLRTVGTRVLSTSNSRAKEQCDDRTQANEWSAAVTTMMTGDGTDKKKEENKPEKRYAVVGAYQLEDGGYELSKEAIKVDDASGGKLSKELNEVQQHLGVGKAFVVTDVGKYPAVAIADYGPKMPPNKEDLLVEMENTRWGVGAGVRALMERGATDIEVDPSFPRLHAASPDGAILAAWQFDKSLEDHTFDYYEKTKRNEKTLPVMIHLLSGCKCEKWDIGIGRGNAQNWARFLSDTPANKMTPIKLANAAIKKLCHHGVNVVAHDRAWIEAQGMEAFLTVARGSGEEPVFLECEWKNGTGPPVLVAAKGVTFDCGGICLKKHKRMTENRGSMAGAAAALGAMWYIAASKAKMNVTMVIPLCENMISGQCMKVGDVVRTRSGIHIKIEDTDMEGRLMLADALEYGQAAHKPEFVIDIATLTHGVRVATGGGAFGAFTSDDRLWECLRLAGETTGDRAWRFPLWDYYQRRITDNPSFDLRNRGSEYASPCIGAAFLRNFVCGRWIHMDTTGVAKIAHHEPPYLSPRRMSGRPTRTLICLLEEVEKLKIREENERNEQAKKDKEEKEKKEKEKKDKEEKKKPK